VSLNPRGKVLGESDVERFVLERSQDIDILTQLHRRISRGECPKALGPSDYRIRPQVNGMQQNIEKGGK